MRGYQLARSVTGYAIYRRRHDSSLGGVGDEGRSVIKFSGLSGGLTRVKSSATQRVRANVRSRLRSI